MRRFLILFVMTSLLGFGFSACQFSSERINLNNDTRKQEPETKTSEKKLTLIVYMAADNDLESYALRNMKAMEEAVFEKVNVIVLLDRSEGYDETNGDWTDTRLFEIKHDNSNGDYLVSKRLSCAPLGLSASEETELDMANYNVLKKLIDFSKAEYPAEKYALILWGHGTGWRAVAVDDKTQSYMCVSDIGLALKNQGLSVIGFDTCFGAIFENIYEFKTSSDYTVASPGVTPSDGWDYKMLLENLEASNYSSGVIADCMAASSSVKTSIIDNSRLNELMIGVEAFAEKLSLYITDSSKRSNVLDSFLNLKSYSYPQYRSDLYIDIQAMSELYENSSDSDVRREAQNLRTVLRQSVKTSKTNCAEIGIHLIPKSGARTIASEHSSDYLKDENRTDQCAFIKESRWWVPTRNGNSGSLLDKLFYTSF